MSKNSLKSEIVTLLRNSDIMTTNERNVLTEVEEETVSNITKYIINKTNVKNIRKIEIETVVLEQGKDYTVNLDQAQAETIVCEITFKTQQSGKLEITYDYGPDRIFSDMPRKDLTMGSYPRISVEEISKVTDALSIGGKDFISNRLYSITVFAENQDYVEEKIELIENLIMTNAKKMNKAYYIRPTARGPIIKTDNRHQLIIQKNVDLTSYYEVKNVT